MPAFRAEHLEEHEAIHSGLDRLEKYLTLVRSTPGAYSAEGLREVLGSFGPILFYRELL